MNWRRKARTQKLVASLPRADAVYYALQRSFGSLRPGRTNPLEWFHAAVRMVEWIKASGREVAGKRFLEVGTGRMVNVPTALWLCGAAQTVTVDLNTYLSGALVAESNQYLRQNQDEVIKAFGQEAESPQFKKRFERLVSFHGDLAQALELMNIEYFAPGDATNTPFADDGFDYHISHAVLEHIPGDVIEKILIEARRILTPEGLLIHVIDPSDHFAHEDKSITLVNFLQFSESEWESLAGNKFMYHNRLRSHEYLRMLDQAGVQVIRQAQAVDEPALQALKSGFPLDRQFQPISPEELAVTSLIVMGTFSHADKPPERDGSHRDVAESSSGPLKQII